MFTHLHAHSEYSISDGLHHPRRWAQAIKARGLRAHALTDHGTMAGILPFVHYMREEGLTPIIGCEFYFVDDPLDKTKENRRAAHVILLAKNYEGYQNLLKLSYLSYHEGFYFKPRIGMEWLAKYSDGVICLTACLGGILAVEHWRSGDGIPTVGVENRFKQLSDIFGQDLYLELQGHAGEKQVTINKLLASQVETFEAQIVITNDCHYIDQEHHIIQEKVKNAAYGKSEVGESYTTFDSLWLKKPDDVYNAFRKNHEYLSQKTVIKGMQATVEIFEKCVDLKFPTKRYLPTFHRDSKKLFRDLTVKHLKQFLSEVDKWSSFTSKGEVVARFQKEYDVITKYELHDYFLIVWDIVRYAKKQGIYVGIGRGSAAGSLISYLLGIVQVNPLEYKLLFERFLNANRCETGELPDIDLDFESERRDEIKEYVVKKYGKDHVCEIGTYGRLKLKNSILDFGKQFGFQFRELSAITTKLDSTDIMSAIDESPALNKLVHEKPEFGFCVEQADGQIKSQSVHPAGVIISDEPVQDVIPLKTQKKKGEGDHRVTVTQSEDKHVIANGMVKMDFLGIDEYDHFKFVIDQVDELSHDNYIDRILSLEKAGPQKEVWEYFAKGKTEAVFQFGSPGMQNLLRDMEANSLDDLIAAVALYRPGCLKNNWHTLYCARKRGDEAVEYVHPDMEDILRDTYGVIIFQEQFMEAFHRIGGVSLVDADTIRSALGKKDEEKLAKFERQFVENAAVKLGSNFAAQELWDQLKQASGYTFNRAHSAVYAIVAYISQYLKVNYPDLFWAAQLTKDSKKGRTEKLLHHRRAAEAMGVQIRPPDIDKSDFGFTVEEGAIRYGLSAIKGLGEKSFNEISRCRPFASFEDFYKRVHKSKVKFDIMMSLISAGAFDDYDERADLIVHLHEFKERKLPPLDSATLLFNYYDAMGTFEKRLKDVFNFSDRLMTETDVVETVDDQPVSAGGMISEIKAIKTRKGDQMGKVILVDQDESLELTFFPEFWGANRTKIKKGSMIEVLGKKSAFNGRENQIVVSDLTVVD